MTELAATLAALVREARHEEAAELAERHGDFTTAAGLYAEACNFTKAANSAERAGDLSLALVHFAEADQRDEIARLIAQLADDTSALELAAYRLQHRGFDFATGLVHAALGDAHAAAEAFQRAGEVLRSAKTLEQIGEFAAAGRTLEAALRRDPSRTDVALWLGELLLRCSKPEAALRVLQRIPEAAREHRAAVTAMATAHERMGMFAAEAEALARLQQLGPASSPPSRRSTPPPTPPASTEELLFGRYLVEEIVHESATARVLRCLDTLRGDLVAVKLFVGRDLIGTGRDALTRFEREILALRALEHPHVVNAREYIAAGPAVVTEWMPQGSLADLLGRELVTPKRAVEIAVAVLGAVERAHTLGILHRDIKPANVLFDAAGTPKLADFGVAHLGDLSQTVTAGVIGTFAYMSPEQRRGQRAVLGSDLYGVGAMLLEMLTGTPPEEQASPSPSAFHRELTFEHDAALRKLLSPHPEQRPASAAEAIRELTALSWPTLMDRLHLQKAPADRPSGLLADDRGRYRHKADQRYECTRSGRQVERLEYEPDHLPRVRSFAACSHRNVQAVLSAQHDCLWLELPEGRALDRSLRPDERAELVEALRALHALGYVHGQISSSSFWLTNESLLLRYSAVFDHATPEDDFAALAALA